MNHGARLLHGSWQVPIFLRAACRRCARHCLTTPSRAAVWRAISGTAPAVWMCYTRTGRRWVQKGLKSRVFRVWGLACYRHPHRAKAVWMWPLVLAGGDLLPRLGALVAPARRPMHRPLAWGKGRGAAEGAREQVGAGAGRSTCCDDDLAGTTTTHTTLQARHAHNTHTRASSI